MKLNVKVNEVVHGSGWSLTRLSTVSPAGTDCPTTSFAIYSLNEDEKLEVGKTYQVTFTPAGSKVSEAARAIAATEPAKLPELVGGSGGGERMPELAEEVTKVDVPKPADVFLAPVEPIKKAKSTGK